MHRVVGYLPRSLAEKRLRKRARRQASDLEGFQLLEDAGTGGDAREIPPAATQPQTWLLLGAYYGDGEASYDPSALTGGTTSIINLRKAGSFHGSFPGRNGSSSASINLAHASQYVDSHEGSASKARRFSISSM